MANSFFIADTHFFHGRILEYCPNTRPFSCVEEMNEVIIDIWNKQVKPNDIVYHLGDFAFTNAENATNLVKSLSGKKDVYFLC